MKDIFKEALIESINIKSELKDKKFTDIFTNMGDLMVKTIINSYN